MKKPKKPKKEKIFYGLGLLTALAIAAALSVYLLFFTAPGAPPTAEKYNASGLHKYEAGNYNGAIKEYTKAIQVNPQDKVSYFGRANAYLQIYLYQKSLLDYNKAIKLDPDNPAYYTNRANAYYGLENYQATLADYDRAIKLNPRDGKLYQRRAFLKEKNFKASQKELAADWKKAIDLGIEDEHVFISYGSYLNNNLQNYEAARTCFQKALKVNPHNGLAKQNLEITLENIRAKKANQL
ncbi:MAG: tetratricopeptide repeat protein [Candidatus Margulisbacteria bacterium]|jgi:tetratricopeptide (TPR) repeat protein|nr:tetratricopeptide repeat protein [Candidatus Margulisiibacteriota bacterium]